MTGAPPGDPPSNAPTPGAPTPGAPAVGFSHLDAAGRAAMVDVGDKPVSRRRAEARGRLVMAPATLARVEAGGLPKGDAFATARIAGIQAAKRTDHLIPLCHGLALSAVTVEFAIRPPDTIDIVATVTTDARTGVEMEALTAVSVAGLTLYDMIKSVDRALTLTDIRLTAKDGGKSGPYRAPGADRGDDRGGAVGNQGQDDAGGDHAQR
ncbi:cyclic pyranopterin monophosphate synthase subunit MoaC [Rhodothalassium salexigens DSM 2132]|uniref:Cyclic pyranopterin monophosphate synthase n=1 Tax=Rhodothalassium salexigens DSM 2132 TaxID=1188247 RepID=A0A4R2PSP5_RHOSA|nr:cyclic pyranopterin monophosphate synthase MoaC [Rhodothalassium salexigens]MBB4209959.1 cyclic pyranopterin phosphate synthase [Rhodothalassium salexigens DSM 2132]MBK1637669.1 cyclic pyranopterin monophosphate synthase MoaC [Rhodothalassium salexigens DSM 2132]TCP38124.1 cyclic pyranopterin monophosphate synthase subunit MoaC [Rhodothalassium salexigens DSM 2132]